MPPTRKSPELPKTISFIRQRDYQLVKELGGGACGKTVLLHDDEIDEMFVCKKFAPYSEDDREGLYRNFVKEIKLLHNVFHQNLVRVFNYYLYPAEHTGYILMEYVCGQEIDAYLALRPEQANDAFSQTANGFAHLERNGILHRDIRPANVMVREDGTVKIIDLGFGKKVITSSDFDKSISLNWWCQPPKEFQASRYDFASEVYFVGKLFESLITDRGIKQFKYADTLKRMCEPDPNSRLQSFAEVEKQIGINQFNEILFEPNEEYTYRMFADALCAQITKLESGVKYLDDIAGVEVQLKAAYQKFKLEEFVPDSAIVLRCFLVGTYYYKNGARLPVASVQHFLRLIAACGDEKKNIILANLHTRFDALPRYTKQMEPFNDSDIPF